MSSVPVEIVDTGTASFGIACCVWAAGEVLAAGGSTRAAAAAARAAVATVDNVFVVDALDLARRGGRLAATVRDGEDCAVLAPADGTINEVGRVSGVDDAIRAMTEYVVERADGRPVRVGVGDALADDVAEAFVDALRGHPEVAEIVRYQIGPSVGAHTGAGTVGACFFRP
jgi:fatty acid kinase fatty acid binding subunit